MTKPLPVVGAERDIWGEKLNEYLAELSETTAAKASSDDARLSDARTPTDAGMAAKVADPASLFRGAADGIYLSAILPGKYGAVGDYNGTAGTDNLAAFNAAFAAVPNGGTVFVPPGRYYFSGVLNWPAGKTFNFDCGASGLSTERGTQLVFAAGSSGLHIDGLDAYGYRVGPFTITSKSTTAGADVGLFSSASGTIDRVIVEAFGSHGIHIKASGGPVGGNANNSILNKLRAYGNRGDGIRLEGSDANACLLIKPDVVANYGWGVNLEVAMTQVIAMHADQQYNSSPGCGRDNGNSNNWDWVYSEGGAAFCVDTNSSYGRLRTGFYGKPALTYSSFAVVSSWDIKQASVERGKVQVLGYSVGDKTWSLVGGLSAVGMIELVNSDGAFVFAANPGAGYLQLGLCVAPFATATQDLGSSVLKWKNGHFSSWVEIGTSTTAARPSAVTAGAGAVMYDTTLSKPIWSDGTVWRDDAAATQSAAASDATAKVAAEAALARNADNLTSGMVADARLPVTAARVQEAVNTVATSGAAQTIPDVTASTISRITLTADCALTFPTAGAGKSFTLALVQDGTGSRIVTWPATIVKWAGGTAPVLSTGINKIDYVTFVCTDGTNWAGFVAGKDVR